MNTTYLLVAVDLVAVLVLALAVYYPRHRRADLVTAFVAVNVGVLAVTSASCRSSGCAPTSSASTRSPTTSPPSPSACSAASAPPTYVCPSR
jgi:hypothetical protein